MGLGDFLFGGKSKQKKQKLKTDEQIRWMQQAATGLQNNPLYKGGSEFLQRMLSNDPKAFADFEDPYMQQFNEQIAPGIAQGFAGMGTGASGLSSSGLNNSLAQAGRSLSTDLAGLRSGLQMNAAGQGLQYAQQPYSNMLNAANIQTFQPYQQQGQPGLIPQLMGGLAGGLGYGGAMGAADWAYNRFQ